jgi:hypothetical protein
MRFTSAIELVNKLEPAHLQSFWYFASKVNLAIIATFGSLLWATSDTPEEAELYRSQLAEYRWILRVSSKAAEFMKFTVGMLDSSVVFLKDGASKTGTPSVVRDQPAQEAQEEEEKDQNAEKAEAPDTKQDQGMPDFTQGAYGIDEVSPSVGASSTDNAYPYEQEYAGTGLNMATDPRPPWSSFSNSVNFTTGDIQDWSLDQLYNFENFPLAEDVLMSRRFIQEYDETGNNSFSGF